MRALFLAILLFGLSSFQSILAAPNVSSRTIKFPSKEVGKISFGTYESPTLEWHFDQKSLISAKGNLRVPATARVHLALNWYGTENLDWLKDLRPDDLEAMDFESMPLTSAGLSKVARLTGLKHLFLEDTDIIDADLLSIAKLKNLVELRITKTGITGKEFRRLSECKNLAKLEVGFNKLTDQSLTELKFLPNLRRLDLSRIHMSDRSLESLSQLKGIKYLCIRGNRDLNDRSMRLLPCQESLLALDLTGVSVTSRVGLELQRLKKLNALRLDGERFGAPEREKLKRYLPNCYITYAVNVGHLPIEIFRPLH